MSVIEHVRKAQEALNLAFTSRDQSPRLDRGAMRAAMEHLDAALADQRGAVARERALAEAILSLADSVGMPDSYRETDSRLVLARETLNLRGGGRP